MNHVASSIVEHRKALLAYAKRHAPPGVDAEDLVSEVSERALSRADQAGAELRGWLFAILRSRVADAYRRRSRVQQRENNLRWAHDAAAQDGRLASIDDMGMSCSCYEHLISDTSNPYADALRRVALDDQSAVEAAHELGISRGAFDVRLHRARKRVQAELEARCGVTTLREARDCACDDSCG